MKYALRRLPKWLVWAACAVAVAGWWWSHRQFTQFKAETTRRLESQIHDARFLLPDFEQALDQENSLVIREGMPRDFNSAIDPEPVPHKTLSEEFPIFAVNDPVRYGYHFREEVRHVAPDERENFRSLLLEPGSMFPWIGPKMCGGFHPDWSLEMYGKGYSKPILELHFCFGCNEVRIYTSSFQLVADLPQESVNQFRRLLAKYPGQNPARPK